MREILKFNVTKLRVVLFLIVLLAIISTDVLGISFAAREDYVDRNNGNLDNILMYGKEQRAKQLVDNLYGDLNEDIKEVIDVLSMSPDSNVVVFNMIRGVSEALVPVGFTIASFFILLSFLDKSIKFQVRSYEDVAKILLCMLLAKVVLMSSFEILGFIYATSASIIQTAGVTPEQIVSDVDKQLLVTQITNMNPLELLEFQISTMPVAVIMVIIKVLIKAIAYGRMFEIYIFTAVSPLPLATLASPDQHQIAKKFFQSYIGVCLQGFIMILSCVIFSALAVEFIDPSLQSSPTGGGTGFLMASVVLLFVMVRSGTWGKQIAGLV